MLSRYGCFCATNFRFGLGTRCRSRCRSGGASRSSRLATSSRRSVCRGRFYGADSDDGFAFTFGLCRRGVAGFSSGAFGVAGWRRGLGWSGSVAFCFVGLATANGFRRLSFFLGAHFFGRSITSLRSGLCCRHSFCACGFVFGSLGRKSFGRRVCR